jgi:carbohydrate-binding DOMON domain-containing protein
MRTSTLPLGSIALVWAAATLTARPLLAAETLTFSDPKGDDNGSGKMTYPTGKEYTPGAFDITKVEVREDGADTVFEIELAAELTDPWNSKDWNGNGFSLQFVQIYLDMDGKKRSGEKKGVPGSWIEFVPEHYYEKVVLLSPQPRAKVLGEVEAKAPWLKKRAIVPERTEARRKSIVARVPTKELGEAPSKKWAVQAVMLSNEGFPAPEDILARRVNEIAGEHRFGGGCDGFGDPQVMDMLAGSAEGEASEAEAQHKELSAYTCGASPKEAKVPQIGMVRR